MRLPSAFLDELSARTSLTQVAGRKVVWDSRRSKPSKGDMWAPCPFHHEKTASFHVDERKGFYYCFGCHAKGNAISFVRDTQNVSFMEAVEILARDAGMEVPAPDPQAKEKADRRDQLADVMEQAVRRYRLQLKTGAAADAREYLAGRGLDESAQDRWEIGFAPNARQGLFEHLAGKSVAPDLIIDAGLCARPEDGGAPYDRFRNRIIFPIRDARGRAIALGGRAMDPDAPAKYLNSPETELFNKGGSLFNHGPAREASGKSGSLIVAEGYMDVIALSEAGFPFTVAPLGTAVTTSQLQMLWRIAPEPVIALDGDKAGFNAAMRLIDLAMPLLEAGRSLRFCLMPSGQDPDDVIRIGGAQAMRKLLDSAQPLVQLLWKRETEGKDFDSPERRAALDNSLRAQISKIPDLGLRDHYGDEIKRLRADLFGFRTYSPPHRARYSMPAGATAGARQSLLAAPYGIEDQLPEAIILAVLVKHPALIAEFVSELENLECVVKDHAGLRAALLRNADVPDIEIEAKIAAEAGRDVLEKVLSLDHIRIVPAIQSPSDHVQAKFCVAEAFAKLAAKRGAEREITEAMKDIETFTDEQLTWRLEKANESRRQAELGMARDETEYDVAKNGAKLSRDELNCLDALLGEINDDEGKARHR